MRDLIAPYLFLAGVLVTLPFSQFALATHADETGLPSFSLGDGELIKVITGEKGFTK